MQWKELCLVLLLCSVLLLPLLVAEEPITTTPRSSSSVLTDYEVNTDDDTVVEQDCEVRLDPLETFRFQWSIHNFSVRPEEQDSVILSPLFPMDPLSKTKWQVAVYPRGRARFMGDVPAFYICLSYHEDSSHETATYKLSIFHKDFERTGQVYTRQGGYGLRFTTSKCFGRILEIGREELVKEYVSEGDVLTLSYQVKRYRETSECAATPACPPPLPSSPSSPASVDEEHPPVRCDTSYQAIDPILRYVWEVQYWKKRLSIPLMEHTEADTEWETEVRVLRERLSPELYLSVHLCLKKTPRPHELALFNVSVSFKDEDHHDDPPWTFVIDTVTYFKNPGPNPSQLYCWGRVATPFHVIFRDKRYQENKELKIVAHIQRLQESVSCATDSSDSACQSGPPDPPLGEDKEMEILAALWSSQQNEGDTAWRRKVVADLRNAQQSGSVALTSDIFTLAHKHGMTELEAVCENILLGKVRVDNVLELLQLADSLEAFQLKEKAVQVAADNMRDISTTKEWRRLNKKQPTLAILVRSRIP